MRVIFTHGKHDFTIKAYVKKLKDNREYIKEMQSWGEMQKVADTFIELIIENDETCGADKRKKRAQQHVRSEANAAKGWEVEWLRARCAQRRMRQKG